MISEQRTVAFVWRCSMCPAVYDGESILLLLDDGTSKACSCGGRLMEGVSPAPEREQTRREVFASGYVVRSISDD
jgi:hypothetical protein